MINTVTNTNETYPGELVNMNVEFCEQRLVVQVCSGLCETQCCRRFHWSHRRFDSTEYNMKWGWKLIIVYWLAVNAFFKKVVRCLNLPISILLFADMFLNLLLYDLAPILLSPFAISLPHQLYFFLFIIYSYIFISFGHILPCHSLVVVCPDSNFNSALFRLTRKHWDNFIPNVNDSI